MRTPRENCGSMTRTSESAERLPCMLCLVLAATPLPSPAAEAHSTDTRVTLSGVVGERQYLDANDKLETAIVLDLSAPVSVRGDGVGGPIGGVSTVQLVWPDRLREEEDYLGKRVRATGKLFYTTTAHHHTRVLLDVETVRAEGRWRPRRG